MASISTSLPTDVLNYLWLVKSNPLDEDEQHILYAGALCVHPVGILITITHAIRPQCHEFSGSLSLQARTYSGSFREVSILENIAYESYGVTLLRVHKNVETETFEYFDIPKDVPIVTGDEIWAYVQDDYHPFTAVTGRISSPSPLEFDFPRDNSSDFTIVPLGNRRFSTVSSACGGCNWVSVKKELSDMIGTCLYDNFESLSETMPLIQVTGFSRRTMDGLCGWPAFSEDGNKLIGLIALSAGFYQYLIPTKILRRVFESNTSTFGT